MTRMKCISKFSNSHLLANWLSPVYAGTWCSKRFGRGRYCTSHERSFHLLATGIACLPKEVRFGGKPQLLKITLPSWFVRNDVNILASKFKCTGFTGGLNYYRAMDLNWELIAAWTGEQIKVPVKFIVGDMDLTYNTPGAKDFIHKGGFCKYVPFCKKLVSQWRDCSLY
ncbi:bifunctional epoxide hydrolase [Tanacetum coccineum]